jgi:hypothetical protein
MQKDDLTALAERVQALAGPDREVLKQVFAAIHPERVPSSVVASGYGWREDASGWWLATGEDSRAPPKTVYPPPYLTSLDAAMTLAKTDAEACAVLHEAMDALSRDCPTQGNWRAHLPRYVVAEVIRVRLAQVQP